jgi:hypothetical protein
MTKKRRAELRKVMVDTFERLWHENDFEDPPWPDMAEAAIDALITKGLT